LKVLLPNPRRPVEVPGARAVQSPLGAVGLDRESRLVIRNGTVVTGDERLVDTDTVEVRPVISGG
jgi:sulfur carrier protein